MFELNNLKATHDFAKKIAQFKTKYSNFLLHGNLGSGKTTFSKFLIPELLNKNVTVTSPTYNIITTYKNDHIIHHYDLYRVKNAGELYELNIEENLHAKDICIIEWPELVLNLVPNDTILIKFTLTDENKRYAEYFTP